MLVGEVNTECGPMSWPTGRSDSPPVVDHYFLADSQPDARTGKLALAMQPLKDLKNAAGLLLFKANAIIGHVDSVVKWGRKRWFYRFR